MKTFWKRHARLIGLALALLFSAAVWALALSALAATPEELRRLEAVNQAVNRQIAYTPDDSGDTWVAEPATRRGDCEDIALTKLRRLLRGGFPGERISLVLVTDEAGQSHAVLLVDGELVLDSRFNWIERRAVLERYGYRF